MSASPRVLIADDHPLFRLGLKLALLETGFDITAEAENGEQAISAIAAYDIEVAILDIKMPVLDGLAACAQLRECAPHCISILLTTFTETSLILAARAAGAKGFLSKEVEPTLLAATIRQILADPDCDWLPMPEAIPHLSPRELEVLRLLDQGCSHKQIAQTLGIRPSTAKEYAGNLYRKLDVDDRIAAIHRSRSLGLL